jgi:hypothetical protein
MMRAEKISDAARHEACELTIDLYEMTERHHREHVELLARQRAEFTCIVADVERLMGGGASSDRGRWSL